MEFIVTIQEPEVQVVTVASQGEQGIAGLIWIDAGWSSGIDYVVNNALEHNGSSYRVFIAHTSAADTEPGIGVDWETVWKLLAEKGDQGTPGTPGTDGTDGVGVPVGGTVGQVLTKQSASDFDTDWEDPGGGGAAEWEPVGSVQEVTSTGINEFLFSGLDFDVYEYRIYARVDITGSEANGFKWYSFEDNAASVVAGDYTANRFFGFNSISDSQVADNVIVKNFSEDSGLTMFNSFFFKDFDGVVIGYTPNSVQYFGLIGYGFSCSSADFDHTTGATKIGIYLPTEDFVPGSKMQLFRKAVL